MSDLLMTSDHLREPQLDSFSGAANPIGLDGIEFVEYATSKPQALGQVLEMMGFRPIARHRSREVTLYRQGGLNIVVNAHPDEARSGLYGSDKPVLSAIALRVRDAHAAYQYVLDKGAWEVPTKAQVMELHIPAIHGPGGSRLYFVDRYKEFSIYDVDFVPIPSVDQHPPAAAGIHFFGMVQYIGPDRSYDWQHFYSELLGAKIIPEDQRFGIMPKGSLMQMPALDANQRFMWQLVEPDMFVHDANEKLQRIGLGVPDVLAAVKILQALGMEFVETPAAHTEVRGAITKTYLGSVMFELVHSEQGSAT